MALPSHDDCRCSAPELSDTLLYGTPYRPVRRLGRGGMGEVIEAAHVGLDKPVVVKLLHRDLNREPRLVERMRVEAQSLARLAHPNLVMVTDFGRTAEGRTFLVMERLYGRTMREELAARGALPPLEALDLVTQTLAGLAAAHGAGIVHRDVKLENLFVCDADARGRRVVKVLDFGIAKVVAPRGDGRAPAPSLYQTEEGVLVGTPRYLSPEQACGLAVDARTDVYAAGVVLYTLLAGRGPFEHVKRVPDLVRAHASEVPAPPSCHAPRPVPPELDRAVMRALEKRPELRFPDAAAFADELSRIAAALSGG
ncbi:protein kinase, partial [Sorangium cellulosum]